jgi:probable rRNA maturation factor
MSIAVDVAVESGRLGMPRALATAAAQAALRSEGVRHAELSLAFVGDRTIAAMNRRHLGHRGTTDVISFGFLPATPNAPLTGDVYIGAEVARRAARERKITLREELVRLVVHGTLHVLGYAHTDGPARTTSRMWQVQERLVARVLRGARA